MSESWRIRRARSDEAELLSALAIRSKAVWGYSAEFMERCRPVLTLTPEYVDTHPVHVITSANEVAGFYSLKEIGDGVVELDLLFIEPRHMNGGFGSSLFQHARAEASRIGYRTMMIESDPGAEPFYLRMGARRTGVVASTVEEGRFLPMLEVVL
jgi:GNAT superfamily N-acetyltransferase